MSADAFLFLQPSDIAHFQKQASRFAGVKRLFIDPGMVEEAVKQDVDLQPFEFRALDVGAHFQARLATEATTRAAALDQSLCRERIDLFGHGHVLQGWDQSLLRQFFVRALLMKYLGELCDRNFPEQSVALFRPRNPQLFYFDSCISVDLFIGTSSRWQVVDEYDAAERWSDQNHTACFDFAAIAPMARQTTIASAAVVHIPATYRHVNEYAQQIRDRFRAVIDLPSKMWDIPLVGGPRLTRPIAETARTWAPDSCAEYQRRAVTVFNTHLSGLIPTPSALAAQVAVFADRCFMQAINFHGLLRALERTQPHFVLTDHDTGNNGPLFSVAAALGSKVSVLPHSSYATGAIPHALNVEVVERSGFATPTRTVWGESVRTRGVRLGPPATRVPRTRVRTVCMLLNGMISNGLFHIDFKGMAAFYKELAGVCEARGVRLLLRLKPTASGVRLIAGALGVEVEQLEAVLKPSIEDVAASSDLCVSFGQPTTGSISFLASGCHLLHACDQQWPLDYAFSPAYFGDGMVQCLDSSAALARITAMLDDPAVFAATARQQFDSFERRLIGGDGGIFDSASCEDGKPGCRL